MSGVKHHDLESLYERVYFVLPDKVESISEQSLKSSVLMLYNILKNGSYSANSIFDGKLYCYIFVRQLLNIIDN